MAAYTILRIVPCFKIIPLHMQFRFVGVVYKRKPLSEGNLAVKLILDHMLEVCKDPLYRHASMCSP